MRVVHPSSPCIRTAFCFIFFLLLLIGSGLSAASTLPDSDSAAPLPPVIRSASEYDYPPYAVVTPDDEADGFSVELLRAALKAMGRDVAFEIGPWSEVKQKLVKAEIAVLPLVGRTPEREHDFDFTFPYLRMHGTIVVRSDETAIRTLDDLKGKQLAVLKGDNAEEFLRRSSLEGEIVTTTTFEEAFMQLAAGEHDAVVVQKLVALQLINRLKLSNLKTVGPPLAEFVQSFCFAVKKGDQQLLSLLNEGLSIVVADGTFDSLHKKWFGPIEALEHAKSRIVIGGDADYPPYEFLDENGQPAGYNVDLTRAIARQLGIEVEIQLRPWAEIRAGLANNEIDLVQGMFYSPERDLSFDFTPAHTLISHVIAVRQGAKIPQSMADLAGKSILVMEGDIMHDVAVKLGYSKDLVLVKSQEEALKLLAAGDYDSALIARLPALYWIDQHGWKNLHLSERPVLTPEYCFAAPHGNQNFTALLTEGLAAIKSTGEYRDIYSRWLGVYEKGEIGFLDVLKYSLFLVIPLIIVLIGSFLWSASLKRQVERATAQLKDERQRLESIIDGTRAGTWEWNVQTGESLLNREWAEMIGYTLEEIAPLSTVTRKSYAHPDDLQRSNACLEAYFRGETDYYECEFRMKHKEGHWVWILSRGKVSDWSTDGKPLWMFGTHLNITKRKEGEEELARLNARLEANNKEMEQILYVTSHDLRSPMIAIEGFAFLFDKSLTKILAALANEKISPETKKELEAAIHDSRESSDYISKSITKMNALLDGLLQVSRLGWVEISKKELDMNALMAGVLNEFEFQRQKQKVTIEVADLPPCSGDPGQINQLFANLIGNALKYADPGRPGMIKVSGQKEGAQTLYCVADNGIGIDPENMQQIFEMFRQLDPKVGGDGLGLCIVNKIAERHDGRVWVESEVGKGSRFYVLL